MIDGPGKVPLQIGHQGRRIRVLGETPMKEIAHQNVNTPAALGDIETDVNVLPSKATCVPCGCCMVSLLYSGILFG